MYMLCPCMLEMAVIYSYSNGPVQTNRSKGVSITTRGARSRALILLATSSSLLVIATNVPPSVVLALCGLAIGIVGGLTKIGSP